MARKTTFPKSAEEREEVSEREEVQNAGRVAPRPKRRAVAAFGIRHQPN
jgi:hypothetical protein